MACPGQCNPYERVLAEGGRELTDARRSDDDIFMLCTGGTGAAKGVMAMAQNPCSWGLGRWRLLLPQTSPSKAGGAAATGAQRPGAGYLAAAPLMHGATMWAT